MGKYVVKSGGIPNAPYLTDKGLLHCITTDTIKHQMIVELSDNGYNLDNKNNYINYTYNYITKDVTSSIKVTAHDEDGNAITSVKTWITPIIDSIYDTSGRLVLKAVYNKSNPNKIDYYEDYFSNKLYLKGDLNG